MTGPRAGLDRRQFLRHAAVGLFAVSSAGVLSACATGGGGPTTTAQGDVSAQNPLGVAADAGLDVVIFKGGYGDEYALFHEELYKKAYPQAQIKHTATTQIAQEMQPRFVAGNPPDVLDNSGAQKIDYATLAAEGQCADLAPLLDAPSLDDPNVKIRDLLLPGVLEQGTYDGKFLMLNYVYAAFPMWYSKPLFDQHGWQPPTTLDEMLALCEQIKAAGIAPWAYGGTNAADYVFDLSLGMAVKQGGPTSPRRSTTSNRARGSRTSWWPGCRRSRRWSARATSCLAPRASSTPRPRPRGCRAKQRSTSRDPGWRTR